MEFKQLGQNLGSLVDSKQAQYGDSVGKSPRMLAVLYPNGIPVHAFGDALLVVRVIDKLNRIAVRGPNGADGGGESPWQDIAGYGLLGARKDSAPSTNPATRVRSRLRCASPLGKGDAE